VNTHHDDFDFEPADGLPRPLPEGEKVLWSGTPDKWQLGHSVFRTRVVAAVFVILAVSSVFSGLNHGIGAGRIAMTFVTLLGVGAAVIGFAMGMGWLIAINTRYTLTNRRLVIRHGVTMPMSINLPFDKIANAAAKLRGDGSGDVSVSLLDGNRASIFAIWPHNRPWSWQGTAPAIRCVAEADKVATLLANALVDHVQQTSGATVGARPKVVRTRQHKAPRLPATAPNTVSGWQETPSAQA